MSMSQWEIVQALADRERRLPRWCHRCAGQGDYHGRRCVTCDGTGRPE